MTTTNIVDKELLDYIKAANLNTIAIFKRFEHQAIKHFGYGPKLARLYYHLSKTTYYDDYNCNFYIYTSPIMKVANQYKLGYSTQTQQELRNRYRTSVPNLDLIMYIPGYIILEYLILNHINIVNNRVINDKGNRSEIVKLPLFTILTIITKIINDSTNEIEDEEESGEENEEEEVDYQTFDQLKVPDSLVTNDYFVYVKKRNFYIDMLNNYTSHVTVKQAKLPNATLDQLIEDRYDVWTVQSLRDYLNDKLKCKVDSYASKIEMLAMLDNYINVYNKDNNFKHFNAYCGHMFTKQQLLNNFGNIFSLA